MSFAGMQVIENGCCIILCQDSGVSRSLFGGGGRVGVVKINFRMCGYAAGDEDRRLLGGLGPKLEALFPDNF